MPALPLASAWPTTAWVLVEANGRRARFLRAAARRLGLEAQVRVRGERAEVVGRDPAERGRHHAVVSRGFGPPAVTAECGAPLLTVGGRLLTSEPPEWRLWPAPPLGQLGMRPDRRRGSIMVLEQVAPCPDRFPRRAPRRRPLF
ncbi:MAG: class I SAM-dependent methyltransferase [Acidimicrobiia bacterium]|nr:class I SAM-dependent methyltransferase [Acidimicrobiia bacterium]